MEWLFLVFVALFVLFVLAPWVFNAFLAYYGWVYDLFQSKGRRG